MRKGSKGVQNKNFKIINGKPLLSYTIKQAINSKLFDKVVISTDSKKIATLSKKYGAECWFLRQKKLSTDRISKILVIRDLLEKSEIKFKKKFEIIFDLDVTSPLRSINDIKKAYKKFINTKASLLFSVNQSKKNPYFNMIEKKENSYSAVINKGIITCRQNSPKVYDMNASIYIWKRNTLINENSLFIKNNAIYEMPEERSFDIDSIFDFNLVNFLLSQKNAIKK